MNSAAAAAATAPGRTNVFSRFVESQAEGIPRTFWFLFVGSLVNRAGAFVVPFLAMYLRGDRGLSVGEVGLVVSMLGLGSAIASPLGGYLADRVGRRATMLVGLVFG